MITILEFDPNDAYRRRTGRAAKFPLNTREEFEAIFGELRPGLFIYEKDVNFDGLTFIELDYLLNRCE